MPVIRALAWRTVRFYPEYELTNLVIADERAQRSHQPFIFYFLGACLPSLQGSCSFLALQLCFVRTIGDGTAILQRYRGCHPVLQTRKASMQRRRCTVR